LSTGSAGPPKNALRRSMTSEVNIMEIRNDFKELLELFSVRSPQDNKHKVEYLIVGGYALAFHGAPRFTGDIDLFVRPARENAKRILAALDEFGFGSLDLSEDDFTTPEKSSSLAFLPYASLSRELAEFRGKKPTWIRFPANTIKRQCFSSAGRIS